MQACVEVANWETLDDICNGIYEQRFDLTLNPPLLDSIFKTLNWIIEPLYRAISPVKNLLTSRLLALKKNKQQESPKI